MTRAALIERVEQFENLETLTGAICNGWYADNWIPVVQGEHLFKVRARQVIFATGSLEQPVVFRNNDLPGIMMSSAAMRLSSTLRRPAGPTGGCGLWQLGGLSGGADVGARGGERFRSR